MIRKTISLVFFTCAVLTAFAYYYRTKNGGIINYLACVLILIQPLFMGNGRAWFGR